MDANELKRLYEQQFEEDLEPPIQEDVDRRTTQGMLRASRGMAAGVLQEQYHQEIWIWSDLHLGHSGTISVFGRPFENPADMDRRLFGVWRRTVRPDDTMICLGDRELSGMFTDNESAIAELVERVRVLEEWREQALCHAAIAALQSPPPEDGPVAVIPPVCAEYFPLLLPPPADTDDATETTTDPGSESRAPQRGR